MIRFWERIYYNAVTHNLPALDPWNLPFSTTLYDTAKFGYFQFSLLSSISPNRTVYTFLTLAIYVLSIWARIYAVSYIGENLFRSRTVGLLTCLLVSGNTLFLNIGNIPYEAMGMVCSTAATHGFLLLSLAAALAGRPPIAMACLTYSLIVSYAPTIGHSIPVLAAATPWMISRCGIKSFAKSLAVMLLVCMPFGYIIFKSHSLGSEYASLYTHERFMILLKAVYLRASAFYFYHEKPVQLLHALLCLPFLIIGVAGIENRRLKQTFMLILGASIGQWLIASILVELQVGLAAKVQLIRSIYWTSALLPIFYAYVTAKLSERSPYLATAFITLIFSSFVLSLNVNAWSLHTLIFLASPIVIYLIKTAFSKKDFAHLDLVLAGLLISVLFVSLMFSSLLSKWSLFALLGIATVLLIVHMLGGLRQQYFKAGILMIFVAIVLQVSSSVKHIRNPFHWPGSSKDSLYGWVNKTPDDTIFLIPFDWKFWYAHSQRRALVARYLPVAVARLDTRLTERIQIMKDTTLWEHIDFRFPEGLQQREIDYMREAWESLTEEEIRNLAKKHTISYVIREQSLPLDLPIAKTLKRRELVIYDISGRSAEESVDKIN